MSRRLSGSRRSPRPTESTRSQNITLSCRCSAGPGEDEGRCRTVAEDAGLFWFSDAPQSEQKFEFAWLGCPHVAHTRDRWAPQLAQNLLPSRSEEHTSELQSQSNLVCRLLLEKKNKNH